MTDYLLLVNRVKHTLHRCLDILDCLIDDAVETNVYFLTLCDGLRGCVRAHIETNNDRVGCGCQTDVGLVDRTNTAVDDLDYDFLVGQLHQALFYCLDRTLYVCLDDQWKFLYISCLDLGEQIVQGKLHLCIFN